MRDDYRSSGTKSGSNHIDSKILLLVVLIAGGLIGGGASYLGMNTLDGDVSKEKAGQMVADTLSRTSGVDYEVSDVRTRNGMYQVQLEANNQLTNYFYVTKNGRMFAQSMTDIEEIQNTLDQQEEVNTCLDSKNVTMYGNLTGTQTRLQIQAMGGPQRVSGYYSDVNTPANLQEAVNRGVQSVPAFFYNGDTLTGVNNLSEISEFANCG